MAKTSGMQIVNMPQLTRMFELMDKNVTTEAREALKAGVVKIHRQAIKNAPVDEYRLVHAIKIEPYTANKWFLRGHITVGGVVAGRDVSQYAMIVHEYPWEKRGPKTRAKGPMAGPRYLARAVKEYRAEILRNVENAMKKGVESAVRQSGANVKRSRR